MKWYENRTCSYVRNDLEATRDFFVRYLDAKSNSRYHNKATDFRSYFLTFEDGARLEIMNKPGIPDGEKALNRAGYIHIAFSLGSKEKVDTLTETLRHAGYNVISGPRTTGDGYYGSNSWSYTRLGKIIGMSDEELEAMLGKSKVLIEIKKRK